MPRPVARRAALAGVVSACLAAAAVPAFAGPTIVDPSSLSTTVSLATAGTGTRQLELFALDGSALTDLDLVVGAPSAFRVQVTDTGVGQLTDAAAGFTVRARLNNLYQDGDPDGAFIPSSAVTVGFPVDGAVSAVGDLAALPRTLLSGSLAGCSSVASLASSLGLDLLDSLQLLAATDLCSALGSGVTVTDLPVVTAAQQTLTGLTTVPFALGGQEPGAFTLADHSSGIGALDGRGSGSGTPRTLLSGTPSLTDLSAELASLVTSLQALPALSADGTGAQAAAGTVVSALAASADPALSDLGAALSALTPAQVTTVLGGLTGTVQAIGLGDLLDVTGHYNAVPVLTAAPAELPAAGGTFTGTMTVTLVQP